MAYTTASSLLLGDLGISAGVNKDTYVDDAADEIDAAIGHLYQTPINVDAGSPVARHSILLLKRINMLIATGRLVLALNSGQSEQLHAYGASMLREGIEWLQRIVNGEILLDGAPKPDGGTGAPAGAYIVNADELSAVDAFYDETMRQRPGSPYPLIWAPGAVTD